MDSKNIVMRRIFFTFVSLAAGIVFVIFDVSILNFLPFYTPDITFIYIMLMTLYLKNPYAVVASAAIGFCLDAVSEKYLGLNALIFFTASYALSYFSDKIEKQNIFAPMLLCCVTVILKSICMFFVYRGIFLLPENITSFLSISMLPLAIDAASLFVIISLITMIARVSR